QRTGPQPSELKPLEARIIELPPEVGGLAGGGGAPVPHPAAATPTKPKVAPPVAPVAHRKKPTPPALPVSPNGTATASAAPAPAAGGAASGTGLQSSGEAGGSGGGGGSGSGPGGLGSDNLGAHAIYAPVPEIPDDLRENAIQTVAVAHFKVTYDG